MDGRREGRREGREGGRREGERERESSLDNYLKTYATRILSFARLALSNDYVWYKYVTFQA